MKDMKTKHDLLDAYRTIREIHDRKKDDIYEDFHRKLIDLEQQARISGIVGENEPFPWQEIAYGNY